MKVNILLSTYNGEQYLKEQVKSIQDQTYQDWQLLIRDDGSTDGTVEIIQELVAQDERIRFINEGTVENLIFIALVTKMMSGFRKRLPYKSKKPRSIRKRSLCWSTQI